MSKIPQKIMNREIAKYQGRIYFLHDDGTLEKVNNVFSTADYNHFKYECHHVIKYTDYERNKSWYEKQGLEMCLIIMHRITHQHLENPAFELPDDLFFSRYRIHKSDLLFNRRDYKLYNDYPRILKEQTADELEYDGCFDEVCV
jgi:hypothetical protein